MTELEFQLVIKGRVTGEDTEAGRQQLSAILLQGVTISAALTGNVRGIGVKFAPVSKIIAPTNGGQKVFDIH